MKKIITLLISALFASAALAATPVTEKPVASAESESLINAQGSNNNADEEMVTVDAPVMADGQGEQDVGD